MVQTLKMRLEDVSLLSVACLFALGPLLVWRVWRRESREDEIIEGKECKDAVTRLIREGRR